MSFRQAGTPDRGVGGFCERRKLEREEALVRLGMGKGGGGGGVQSLGEKRYGPSYPSKWCRQNVLESVDESILGPKMVPGRPWYASPITFRRVRIAQGAPERPASDFN